MKIFNWLLLISFVAAAIAYLVIDHRKRKTRHRTICAAFDRWSKLDQEKDKHFWAYRHALREQQLVTAQWHLHRHERLVPQVELAWRSYKVHSERI